MKIAQIAPLAESVPPRLYGGTERIVSYLTEELVRAGPRRHAVRQRRFGHRRPARPAAPPTALRLDPAVRDALPHHLADARAGPPARATSSTSCTSTSTSCSSRCCGPSRTPSVTTLHGRLDLPDLQPFYRAFPDVPLVSISDDQRAPMPPVQLGRAPSITACRATSIRFSPRADRRLSRLPRPHLAGEAPRPRHRDRRPRRHAAEDRGQGRQGRPRLLAGGDRAAGPRQPAGRVRRRDRRAREGGLPRRRHGAPLPDRLARAVRPGHDRGHGLRHAGHRLPLRLGARGDRRRRHRLPRRQRRRGGRRGPPRRARSTARGVRAAFERRFTIERVAATTCEVYQSLCGTRPPARARRRTCR